MDPNTTPPTNYGPAQPGEQPPQQAQVPLAYGAVPPGGPVPAPPGTPQPPQGYGYGAQPPAGQPYQQPTPGVPPAPVVGAPVGPPAGQPLPTAHRTKTNPNSTQNILMIAEVRDGVVIMHDGSFRAVVMVKSINFDLMSPQEREAVEYGYQGFLNSLYFPVQIYIRSERIDLRPYLDKLDRLRIEQDNMLLSLLMEDYIQFISLLAEDSNIMAKHFYLVIPFYPNPSAQKAVEQSRRALTGTLKRQQHVVTINEADLEKAKTELRNRVQAALNGLLQMGLQGVPLDTQELIELYYQSYNPETAPRQQITDLSNLSSPVILKGDGEAKQPHLSSELQ